MRGFSYLADDFKNVTIYPVMGRKNKKKTKTKSKKLEKKAKQQEIDFEEEEKQSFLHPETKKSVLGVVFLVLAIISLLAYFDLAGIAGQYIKSGLLALFGIGFFIVPITFLMISIAFFKSLKTNLYLSVVFGGVLFFLSFLGFIDVLTRYSQGSENLNAGWIGFLVAYPFYNFFGFWVSSIIFLASILISIALAFNVPIKLPDLKRKQDDYEDEQDYEEDYEEEDQEEVDEQDYEENDKDSGFISKTIETSKQKVKNLTKKAKRNELPEDAKSHTKINPSKAVSDFIIQTHQRSYKLPPIELLDSHKGKPAAGDVKTYSELIRKTLKHFGIEVQMGEVNVGPTVTQYTLKPAQGVKLAKIVALQNDLALALAAHPIRIEAPIPGKSLVGIEIPNKVIAVVKIREMIDSPAFLESSPLTVALGKDVSGMPQYADIEKMPHLLIAGTTGSGKSVCLHTILTSLLYKNFPQMLKFLMVDPKMVELTAYNGIPHLLSPVITKPEKAVAALNWAIKEMERRYEFLSEHNCRNIESYNSKVTSSEEESVMPYIVIVIDELADLMSVSAREVEASIVRLAQMARAVGMHLIISTQRPSVDVITGLIKANIPCRIALQVKSIVDSRTILDMSGAEKLLGSGDMLYLPQNATKPKRIQCSFISEKEVKKVVNYLKKESEKYQNEEENEGEETVSSEDLKEALERKKTTIDMDIDLDSFVAASNQEDELFDEAKETVIKYQKASTSFLQRKLKIGYSRAARLMDLLEEHGVVGPQEGSKPREIYISKEESQQNDDDKQ